MCLKMVVAWLAAGLIQIAGGEAGVEPVELRCEYRVNPEGMDVRIPRLSWTLESEERGQKQTAYQVLVASSREALDRDEGDLWDSGRIESDRTLSIPYGGSALESRMQCWWKVRIWDRLGTPSGWSNAAYWSTGLFRKEDWSASWIGIPRPLLEGESEDPHRGQRPAQPAPMLRRTFQISGRALRATLYITARGVYEVRLNGERVGDHILAPEWTAYDKRLQYQTFDVTDQLRRGENALGVIVGEGWYAGRLAWDGWPDVYGEYPRLLLQLEIELADGRKIAVVSDEAWRGTLEGPIRASGLYDGETVDARLRMPGWDRPGFNDSEWIPVDVEPLDDVELVWQRSQPIGIIRELRPLSLTEPGDGVYVYDLGQNMVGWCRLKVRGSAGDTVRVRHAERLNPDGTIYTANLRGAGATEKYILSDSEEDLFEPRFTYHGFRYVEVTGLRAPPEIEDLTGLPFCSRAPEISSFECSSQLVNRLMQNILWGQRGNLHGIPTDCPQRDERLGWTGDILAFSQTAIFNTDMAAFFYKFAQDLRDAQTPDGRYPDFAPMGPARNTGRFGSVPAWGDAGVVIPWRVYLNYGDRRLLEEHFESARKWIDFIHAQNPDLIWVNACGNNYSDWVNGDTVRLDGFPDQGNAVPKDLFATAFFANSTKIVAEMAAVLERTGEARHYSELQSRIREAFNEAFVQADGRLKGDTQAGYAIALNMDLLDDEVRPIALQHMLEAIERYNGHISTGFHAAYRLMLELSRNGRHEEACHLVGLRTPPSWGYMIEQGATTMWERWDGYVEGRGFHDPGMNSFNHYMFGSVGEWVWRNIVGLNPDEERPGYRHFTIHPRPGPGFSWARGEYDSVCGKIVCNWRLEGERFHLDVTIPANTTATVYLQTEDTDLVLESGRPVEDVEWVKLIGRGSGMAVYRVDSGHYAFSAPMVTHR